MQIPTLMELINLARVAGLSVEKIYSSSNVELEWKGDGTPLTAADRAVHDLVIEFMTKAYPDIPVIGEEGQLGMRTGASNECWLLVDEVDGTWAFMLGVPVFTIMFTLMRGNVPMIAVIYDPIGKRLYSAERGKGAFLNDKQIFVASALPKVPNVGFVSWPKRNHPSDMLIPGMVDGVVAGLHKMGCIPVNMVTNGYFGAMVANGQLSGMIFPGRTLQDVAPVDLLVREAVGKVTDLRGDWLSYGNKEVFGYVASQGGDFHDKLVELIRGSL